MAGVRFADVQFRPAEFLNLTSLTLEEFQVLVAPFEAAFQEHMAAWRLDGKPRTARRFTVYRTCPLATPEERLFFVLTYLKTAAVQVVQGRLFGLGQSKANQWIHVLLPALLAALRTLGDAPARSLTALAHPFGQIIRTRLFSHDYGQPLYPLAGILSSYDRPYSPISGSASRSVAMSTTFAGSSNCIAAS